MLKLMTDETSGALGEPTTDATPENDSHELDLVTFFSTSNHAGEMEAMAIHSILEANGIPSVLVGASSLPSLEFQVQVPQSRIGDAERAVNEARDAGSAAADEAEAATEQGTNP